MKHNSPRKTRRRNNGKSLRKTITKFVSDYKRAKSKTRILNRPPSLSA